MFVKAMFSVKVDNLSSLPVNTSITSERCDVSSDLGRSLAFGVLFSAPLLFRHIIKASAISFEVLYFLTPLVCVWGGGPQTLATTSYGTKKHPRKHIAAMDSSWEQTEYNKGYKKKRRIHQF
jgi:hypothetical protein